MILTGTKIKVTLTILKTNKRVFQISYLRLSHFSLKNKQRFSCDGITNLKEKVTTVCFDFTKYVNFSCRSRMQVSLKIYVTEQSLIIDCHYERFCYKNSYHAETSSLIYCSFDVI